MKIAIIAPSSIPARRANTIQVMKMAQAFISLGHEARIAAPGKSPHRIVPGSAAFEREWQELALHYGLNYSFEVDWLAASPYLHRYDYGFRAVAWARTWKADVLYTRLPQAAAFSSTLRQPTIFEVHDLPHGRMGRWLFIQYLRGRGNSKLVVITASLQDDLSKQFGKVILPQRTIIEPDGVDLQRYKDIPQPEEARHILLHNKQVNLPECFNGFSVGYSGHIYPGRGLELMLELATRLPDVFFLIVGGEPEQVEIQKKNADERKTNNVLFTGFVPNAELPLFQAACDVLLMPYQTRVEASSGGDISRYLSPMKLFEYLACGRAIISSNIPVLQEVLNSRNAILVNPDDIEGWIEAILLLKNDQQFRFNLASQAHKDATRFSWEGRATRILQEIEA